MSDEKEDEQDALYRVDTVPPPAGEDDAYSAPTRIGELPDSVLEQMRAGGHFPPPPALPGSQPSAASAHAGFVPGSLPRVNVDEEDHEAATRMFGHPPPGTPPLGEPVAVSGVDPNAARSGQPFPLTAPFGPVPLPPPVQEEPFPWVNIVAVALGMLAIFGLTLLVAC